MKYGKILTQDEVQSLIDACDLVFKKKETSEKFKLIIRFFITTGVRDSELINAKPTWIIKQKKEVSFIRIQSNDYPVKFQPKYLSEREVPITNDLLNDLEKYLGKRKGGYIFRSQNRKDQFRYNKRTIINNINTLAKKVFKTTIGTHIFRRTFASYIYAKFKDLLQVQKLMGHASPEVTWRYIKKIPTRENYAGIINLDIFKY